MRSRSVSITLCAAVATSLCACATEQGAPAAPQAVETAPAVVSDAAPAAPAPVATPLAAGGNVTAPGAQVQPVPPVADPNAWQFSADMYVWLLDIDGNISKNGHTVPVSSHLSDTIDLIVDNFDLALAGHVEARKGDWTAFLDVNYASFAGEDSASREILNGVGLASGEMSFDMEQILTEVGGTWRMTEIAVAEDRKAPVELLAGLRWNHMAMDADLETTVQGPKQRFEHDYEASFSTEWVDPFIGARTFIPLSDKIGLLVRGDIGGGFGSGSDFAWNVVTGLIIKVNECTDTFIGYHWYEFERTIEGRDTNLQMEGPGIGLTIRF